MLNEKYIPLGKLAGRLNLPESYLKELSEQRIIPALKVRGRLRFNPIAVQQALDKLAAKGDTNEQ